MGNCVLFHRPRVLVLVLCISIVFTCIWYLNYSKEFNDNYFMKLVNNKLSLIVRESSRVKPVIIKAKNPGLILDTAGCKITKLDPFDPSIIDLYEAKKEPYDCPGPPLFMSSQPDGSITLNSTVLDVYYNLKPNKILCVYQSIHRNYEKPGNVRENSYDLSDFEILNFNRPLNEDYVVVYCDMGGKGNFTQYFPLVRLKKEVEEVKSAIPSPIPKLNVIVTGIDSISKLSFLRHFRKTQRFMKEKGNFFEMKGYVKVGDNTFPNLTPLLTGQHVETLWNETVKDTMFFDDVDIIWKRYSSKGYRTLYAEDSPYFGTFNYGRRGFNNTPTDYYLRPLYLAMHNSELRNKGSFYCFNSQLETDVIYDYLRDYVRAMGPRPYFAFTMVSSLTHDYFNYAGYADYPAARLLEDLSDMGALNDSVIIFFSDHGIRFGSIRYTYVGKYEERMPFLYIHFPPWFLEQYPHIHKHLQDNTERLVTFFDVYATLVHLLDPTSKPTQQEKLKTSPYGLSLMDEISPYRTCEKAGIFPHWCTCQVFQYVSPRDQEIMKSSVAIQEYFKNKLLTSNQFCQTIEIEDVKEAKLGQLNDLVLRFIKHEGIINERCVWYGERIVKYEDFLITLVTKPCGDIFEATVRHDVEDDSYDVVDINNIDYDLNKHSCINDENLKQFCCCK